MTRIISDTYTKENKQIWGDDPNTDFNRRILAVNNMYGWLYENGILEKVSFVFKDYESAAHFAVDARELLPYRSEMEQAQIGGASLAVRHIFDEPYTPCHYSGAIELGWTMRTYRSNCGCVGSSWECGLVKHLNDEGIYKISDIKDALGIKAAVQALYEEFDWNLTIPEQKQYQEALNFFNHDVKTNIENDYVKKHGRELIYCYEHKKSLIDFDFWTCYEDICNEKLTYDEYLAIDRCFYGDPHEIEPTNTGAISKIKENLQNYRNSVINVPSDEIEYTADRSEQGISTQSKTVFRSLADQIQLASSKSSEIQSEFDSKNKNTER